MRERTAMNRRKNTIRKQLTISYVFLILLSTVLLNIVQFCQIYKYTKDQQQNEIEKEFIQTKKANREKCTTSIVMDLHS